MDGDETMGSSRNSPGSAAAANGTADAAPPTLPDELQYIQYSHAMEDQYLPAIRALISKDLSEPYSIYVYRYFLQQWSHLCYMAIHPETSALIGVIICKLETHTSTNTHPLSPPSPPTYRGYIAMLAVQAAHRGHGVATALVRRAIAAMTARRADEVVLETEEDNRAAMRLYERLGFLRSKKLHRYYLNGNSAFRLVLVLRPESEREGYGYEDGNGVGQDIGSFLGLPAAQAAATTQSQGLEA